ncbi:MAG: heavy metal translocating P-type ATPase [Eubacterium sp.]|nr:heavy metal translocating P-type ATPase [Eubacterium sp.]
MSKKQKRELRNILIAGAIYACLLVLEHLVKIPALFDRWYLALAVYLVPYCIVGLSVLRKAALGIRNRQVFDESFLMTLATIGAFATRENSEAVAVMLFYQVGEFFQGYAVGKSRQSIRDLMDIAPEHANVERADGTIETVDPDDVEIDDILVIRPGEKIPVDGVVTEGEGLINTSALTGESVPRTVRKGSDLISGCINGDALLRMRATKLYDDSTVAKILELVETASEKKSRTENFITRFARYYTPVVVIGALILALVPPLFAGHWSDWIIRACTFLVISCPCALVISVPLAFFGGIGAASKAGVLVKGSNYLELMAHLDTIVTDKTGTLTRGQFEVLEIRPYAPAFSENCSGILGNTLPQAADPDRTLLSIAAAAESMSTHPIAVSIQDACRSAKIHPGEYWQAESSRNVAGQGIIARLQANVPRGVSAQSSTSGGELQTEKVLTVYAGNRQLLASHGITIPESAEAYTEETMASTVLHLAAEQEHPGSGLYLGTIYIGDEVKAEASEALAGMRRYGVKNLVMLTGDRRETGLAVAESLGIDTVFAELLPQDKVLKVDELLEALQQNNRSDKEPKKKLAFIGDGINDAPVLSRADVGIAMGSMGSDAAIEAADIVIMDDRLSRIPAVMQVAKRTVGISLQNIVFALAVKCLILVLGALGLAGMWAAVFADVGVAVLCILNSMRLLGNQKNV